MRPRLLFCLPAINPYWNARLNVLQAEGAVDFHVLYFAERGVGRQWVVDTANIKYSHTLLTGSALKRLGKTFRCIFNCKPTHLLTFHFIPYLWPLFLLKLRGVRIAFYVEKTFDSWVKRNRWRELAKKLVFRQAAVIFSPGPDAVAYVQSYTQKPRFLHLNHAVDLDFFGNANSRRNQEQRVRFLYLGRLIPEKGIACMLRAFENLDQSHSGSWSLTVVGEGSMWNQVSAWIKEREDRASLHTFIQADGISEVFARTDILVFPTTGDPYGLVVNEAMASGMSIISSDAAGEIKVRLLDGSLKPIAGSIFNSGDSDQLYSLLAAAIESRHTWSKYGRNARLVAVRDFGYDRWAAAIHNWTLINTSSEKIG